MVIRDRVVEQAATDSLIGYSKCQIIGTCDTDHGEELGRPCFSARNERGFCNYDAEGDWLCMRTALWWSYGAQYATDTEYKHDIRENVGFQSTVGADNKGQPVACTPGTKATTDLSGEWQPRLLIGGCMISSDSWHTGWEEVHLPDACHVNVPLPANLGGIGCMDKGATNFNAAARQPGKCKYSNTGCTSPLALNYNSEADVEDAANPCIFGTCGCSMGDASGSAYTGVDPSTDKYKSMSVAVPLPNGGSEAATGKVVYTDYSAVMEDFTTGPAYYASGTTPTKAAGTTATVLGDRSSGYSGTRQTLKNNRFGYGAPSGTGKYDTSATVSTSCTIHNQGCTDATAGNYQSWATVLGTTRFDKCYAKKIGRAHKKALNYGCTDFISDTGTGMGGQVVVGCEAGQENGASPITTHQNSFCLFYEITVAEGNKRADSASITLVVSGECTDFTAALKTSLADFFLLKIGSRPEITANCGSLVIENVFTNLEPASFQKFQLVAATALSTNES